jgi:hypothetical protein
MNTATKEQQAPKRDYVGLGTFATAFADPIDAVAMITGTRPLSDKPCNSSGRRIMAY